MDDIAAALLQYGLPGIGLLAMGGVIAKLYMDNQALHEKIAADADSRFDDAKEDNKTLMTVVASDMESNRAVVSTMADIGRTVEGLKTLIVDRGAPGRPRSDS